MKLEQTLLPQRRIFYRGDAVTFRLKGSNLPAGQALLRTNLGMGQAKDCQTVRAVEEDVPPSGRDWRDLPMYPAGADGEFELTLPLLEVGIFEAKAGFRIQADGQQWLWPEGPNMRLKIEPSESVGSNLIYTAFVRQFHRAAKTPACASELDHAGYTVIPPSGTFRQLIGQLDFILGELGSRILQLLPIHPAPTVYGRMGRFGSPFAALDYFAVNPEFAEFDTKATPLEQFHELVNAVHSRHGRIFLDIPVNHTGWGSRLQTEHPEWFVRHADGTIESPGAWGVVWEDLCKLDYRHKEVVQLMAQVFLYWSRHGVDGFRCDAGYMLPESAWEYIVAKVRQEFPDAIFLLEGLGGPIPVQERLLGHAALDWGYSELFQCHDFHAIRAQQEYIHRCSGEYGLLVNFAETHDNSRLAAVSATWSRMRLGLCALLSENGGFGFANGVEWLATEQINVHENRDLRWGGTPNLVDFIKRLQKLLAGHPAFYAGAEVRWLDSAPPVVMLLRQSIEQQAVLVLINLDCEHPAQAHWRREDFAVTETTLELFGDRKPSLGATSWQLAPGAVAVLLEPVHSSPLGTTEPPPVLKQRARLLAAAAWMHWRGFGSRDWPEPAKLAKRMCGDYAAFLREAAESEVPPVTVWETGRDPRRTVPIANGDLLSVRSPYPFRAALWIDDEQVLAVNWSVPSTDGKFCFWHTALPENTGREARPLRISVAVFEPGNQVRREEGTLLLLPSPANAQVHLSLPGGANMDKRSFFLGTTALGGMCQVRGAWGMLRSKYDAWLAANVEKDFPTDRRVMLSRVRAWVVVDAYSQELNAGCVAEFSAAATNCAEWKFLVPMGSGRSVALTVELQMNDKSDAVLARFLRPSRTDDPGLPDSMPLKIILRPDIDDRINHEVTKAYQGAEHHFPRSVTPGAQAFDFVPAPERHLRVAVSRGRYVAEPEWHYMNDLPFEQYYGLENSTDLFSPGYFEFTLAGGEHAEFQASVNAEKFPAFPAFQLRRIWQMEELAAAALQRFVVKRGHLASVIAGYPWFLDWGRDTLIALRGLIAAGFTEPAQAIIRQFAGFEKDGTIPNMIRGNDVSNRDTSDAPLWLFVATGDYIRSTGRKELLDEMCGDRPLRTILESILAHYSTGTPNGIAMDPDSGLIHSPPHFTWMDTNFPAASPREGYPIEIQALWFAANDFMAQYGGNADCAARARQVSESIKRYFYLPESGRFSDCLHGGKGIPAAKATADDAVRPNQLFALTLGAIREPELQRAILAGAEELLVPGAIRSLSDRPVHPPLAVHRDGKLLNDPEHPYCGYYRGPEDTSRKVAYHNGTAWCWPFPSYLEALYLVSCQRNLFRQDSSTCAEPPQSGCVQPVRERALALLYSNQELWGTGTLGELPEIVDGDAPHLWGGCGTQAWSVTEFYRVNRLLSKN